MDKYDPDALFRHNHSIRMLNRFVILLGLIVATAGVSPGSMSVAEAAWQHPAAHGQFDAVGNCNGYTNTDRGTWNFSGLLNSDLLGGDTYSLRFTAYTAGAPAAWSGWYGPYAVAQSPSTTWISLNVFHIQRRLWWSVWMELHSARLNQTTGDWLKHQRVGGDLSALSGDEHSCTPLG